MKSLRLNLVFALLSCALAAQSAGCMRPWSPTFSNGVNGYEHTTKNGASPTNTTEVPPLGNGPTVPGLANTDMAGVLESLQQVRAIDPAAEQKLLDELKRAPAESWPLVAEQFRASLAYHKQLAAKDQARAASGAAAPAIRRAPPTESSDPSSMVAAVTEPSFMANDRPSTRIGALVDPHAANSESDPILARSLPYAMPSPIANSSRLPPTEAAAPAEFISQGPVAPIASQRDAKSELAAHQTAAPETSHVATQALATSDGPSAPKADSEAVKPDENWQQLVERAAADLSERVAPSPATTAEVHQHVSLRMMRLLAGDTEKALEPIPHIPPAEQDYWSRQIFGLATYLDHHSQPDDKRRAAASVTHLDEAVSHLRELGSLSLRNLSFCKNVYGYGAFEAYEADTFTPGQKVSLYVEVENYHSEPSEKGYNTSLGSTYELLNDKGTRVSGGEFPEVEDCCRSRRRDFHIQFGLAMPQNLAPGRYRLELVVKDRQSDKIGHATAAFEIQPSN